ncbi:hypothetical protein J5X84_15085 [Streptosporangiaceae bacterium NEAU-GS5]|nr:hypothetical protein [Streptosporangiaceae bacterium NEAU-GS5]
MTWKDSQQKPKPARKRVAPIYAGEEITFEPGPLRDECWQRLGPSVGRVLRTHAGAVIEWSAGIDGATDAGGRPRAVVLGDQGLCFADPRLDADGRPVYVVSMCVLNPQSFRRFKVDYRPGSTLANGGRRPWDPRRPGSGKPAIAGLAADDIGLIGNLPPQAQELLQIPFLDGAKVLRAAWHYEGSKTYLDNFMVVLAGRRDITAAYGRKTVPAGHSDETAHWLLTCVQAGVTKTVGMS